MILYKEYSIMFNTPVRISSLETQLKSCFNLFYTW